MPSSIDPTKPATGVPASKADLRANLQAAKTELEHGGYYTPAGTGAVTRSVETYLRDLAVSVKDFGAAGDGTTDDSNAIEAAIDAVNVASANSAGSKSVYFPKGNYRITRPVFSHTAGGATHRAPIKFVGEHGLASTVLLDPPSASEEWMYNNVSTPRYFFCEWHNMGFRATGTNAAYASGFRFYSTGNEQGFKWYNCYFGQRAGLRRAWLMSGTGNDSEIVVAFCHIRNIAVAVFTFDNSQSVNVDFIATNVEGSELGDIFVVTSNGGGYLRVWGGSYIWGGSGSMTYLLNLTGSFNLTHKYSFYAIRPELWDAEAGLVKKTGVAGIASVFFHDVDFRTVTGAGSFEGVTIAAGCTVLFDNCWLSPEMTYRLTNTDENSGTLVFRDCKLPDDCESLITLDGYGHASARHCQLMVGSSEPKAVDFDKGWWNAMRHNVHVPIKRVVLKTKLNTWPETTASDASPSNTASDRTVTLPANSRITGIRVYKPAAGAGTANYQLHVGANDRGTIYASSNLAAEQAAHVIDVQFSPDAWINVGTDANLRKVTLWADPGGNNWAGGMPNLTNEVALIEYI